MSPITELAVIALAMGVLGFLVCSGLITWRVLRTLHCWRHRIQRARKALPGRTFLVDLNSEPEVDAAWWQAHRLWLTGRAVVGRADCRPLLRQRRDLSVHVYAAEKAVAVARSSGASVGELPKLTAHLKDVAWHHDQALALLSKSVAQLNPTELMFETERIVTMADRASTASIQALRADAAIGPRHLADLLGHEAEAVLNGATAVRGPIARVDPPRGSPE